MPVGPVGGVNQRLLEPKLADWQNICGSFGCRHGVWQYDYEIKKQSLIWPVFMWIWITGILTLWIFLRGPAASGGAHGTSCHGTLSKAGIEGGKRVVLVSTNLCASGTKMLCCTNNRIYIYIYIWIHIFAKLAASTCVILRRPCLVGFADLPMAPLANPIPSVTLWAARSSERSAYPRRAA